MADQVDLPPHPKRTVRRNETAGDHVHRAVHAVAQFDAFITCQIGPSKGFVSHLSLGVSQLADIQTSRLQQVPWCSSGRVGPGEDESQRFNRHTLPHADVFLTVEYHRLERPVDTPYAGPYQGRDELAPEDIRVVMEREYMSQTEMMRTLETLVSTVDGLKQSLNWRLPLTMGLIVAAIMTIVTSVITVVVTLVL